MIFGSIYNLHQLGAKQITSANIEDYLEQRPKKLAVYKANKGAEYLDKVSENSQLAAFNYYYHRMKKMTLLRMFNEKVGMDLSWLYDFESIVTLASGSPSRMPIKSSKELSVKLFCVKLNNFKTSFLTL